MAGYSGTPLAKKLGIKPGHHVALINGPDNIERTLGKLPEAVTLRRDIRGAKPIDVIVLFAMSKKQLATRFAKLASRLAENGGLWIGWPKKSSGVATDLCDGVVREFGLSTGLVDNKVCAIDETWSGLRFVIRLKDRK